MKVQDFICSLLLAGLASCVSLPIQAQSTDQAFVNHAASGGMDEVKLGQLAQQNGSSSAVKEFGTRMVEDHSKAGSQLNDAASHGNMSVPSGMNKTDESSYNRLSKLSGADFDKAYADEMVKDHQKDIAVFKKEAQAGTNPEIKQFASQTLPTLQDHLKMAQAMQNSVRGNNGLSSGTPETR